jgi:hypothetical protein
MTFWNRFVVKTIRLTIFGTILKSKQLSCDIFDFKTVLKIQCFKGILSKLTINFRYVVTGICLYSM